MTTTVHDHPDNSEPDSPELSLLYDDFKREHLTPLWTQVDDLMPMQPTPVLCDGIGSLDNTCVAVDRRGGRAVPS